MPHASMRCLVRGELRKVALQPINWILPIFAIGLGVLVANGAGDAAPKELGASQIAVDTYRDFAAAAIGATMLAVSAQLVALEHHYGTAKVIVARGLGRLDLLVAKLAALVILALPLLGVLAIAGAIDLAIRLGHSPAQVSWHEVWLSASIVCLSAAVCTLLGGAAGAIGRSMTFAMTVVAGFFPADNLLNYVLQLVQNATQEQVWGTATAYLLGPTLNQLPAVMMGRPAAQLPGPEVAVGAGHGLVVVAAYVALAAGAAALVTWRRDLTT